MRVTQVPEVAHAVKIGTVPNLPYDTGKQHPAKGTKSMWLLVKNTRGKEILKPLDASEGQVTWRQQAGLPPGGDDEDDDDDNSGGGSVNISAGSGASSGRAAATSFSSAPSNAAAVRAARERGIGTAPPPSGITTLMFTDLEGSTKLWEALPDDFKALLDLHSDIVRTALKKHNGYEVKNGGGWAERGCSRKMLE